MKKRVISVFLILAILASCLMVGCSNKDAQEQRMKGSKNVTINKNINSDYAIVMDITNNHVVFEKKAREKTKVASLVKIMTGIVVIENLKDLDKKIRLSPKVSSYLSNNGSGASHFQEGENPTGRDLIYGMLFNSAAECCLALAEEVSGSEPAFLKLMNNKAKELGMKDTTFGNTIGNDDPPCYTTVYDMAVLLKYALKNKTFKRVVTDSTYTIDSTNLNKESRTIENDTLALFEGDLAGVIGGKIGNTEEAELCLATYAKVNGIEYIGITSHAASTLINNNGHIDDARTLYNAIGASGQGK
ncbi:MAG: serine hydrolase [Anaerovoracaceae bacterium]